MNPACPFCGTAPKKVPARSYTCKGCNGRVFVKSIPTRLTPLLLGEDRAIAFDTVVKLFGGRAGAFPVLDRIAGAIEQPDHHLGVDRVLHDLERLDVLLRYQLTLGLDHLATHREIKTAQLDRLRTEHAGDPARGVFMLARYGACPACRALEHRWMSFEDAARLQPLPCVACTRRERHATSFCRCDYVAARPDQEGLAYMSGGGFVVALQVGR